MGGKEAKNDRFLNIFPVCQTFCLFLPHLHFFLQFFTERYSCPPPAHKIPKDHLWQLNLLNLNLEAQWIQRLFILQLYILHSSQTHKKIQNNTRHLMLCIIFHKNASIKLSSFSYKCFVLLIILCKVSPLIFISKMLKL